MLTENQIEQYYEEFIELPALERQKKMYTFETYCKSRKDGWSKDEIKKYFEGSV